ncbi:hypothetical protein HAX54_037324 [Datura stramonium]|uniref:Uncharacterized protein n=1 Tax=Datura stramonium TaxID=4076 RepID=A0ABS8RGW9_DATST|nr:hypothetical protein [Datura stramonium]
MSLRTTSPYFGMAHSSGRCCQRRASPLSAKDKRMVIMKCSSKELVIVSLVLVLLAKRIDLKNHGSNLRTHSIGRCENKWPVLCACRFHSNRSLFPYNNPRDQGRAMMMMRSPKKWNHESPVREMSPEVHNTEDSLPVTLDAVQKDDHRLPVIRQRLVAQQRNHTGIQRVKDQTNVPGKIQSCTLKNAHDG